MGQKCAFSGIEESTMPINVENTQIPQEPDITTLVDKRYTEIANNRYRPRLEQEHMDEIFSYVKDTMDIENPDLEFSRKISTTYCLYLREMIKHDKSPDRTQKITDQVDVVEKLQEINKYLMMSYSSEDIPAVMAELYSNQGIIEETYFDSYMHGESDIAKEYEKMARNNYILASKYAKKIKGGDYRAALCIMDAADVSRKRFLEFEEEDIGDISIKHYEEFIERMMNIHSRINDTITKTKIRKIKAYTHGYLGDVYLKMFEITPEFKNVEKTKMGQNAYDNYKKAYWGILNCRYPELKLVYKGKKKEVTIDHKTQKDAGYQLAHAGNAAYLMNQYTGDNSWLEKCYLNKILAYHFLKNIEGYDPDKDLKDAQNAARKLEWTEAAEECDRLIKSTTA